MSIYSTPGKQSLTVTVGCVLKSELLLLQVVYYSKHIPRRVEVEVSVSKDVLLISSVPSA